MSPLPREFEELTRRDLELYLVCKKFPAVRRLVSPRLGERRADAQEIDASELAAAQEYARELRSKPHNEIVELARQAGRRIQQENDAAAFFNRPDAMADYAYWCRVATWSPDQTVALTLGRDPRRVNWNGTDHCPQSMRTLVPRSPFAREYEDRKRVVESAFRAGDITTATPWSVAEWAKTIGIRIALEWEAELASLGKQVKDLRGALEEREARIVELEIGVERPKVESERLKSGPTAASRRNLGGRPSKWDWSKLRTKAWALMKENGGPPGPDGPPRWRTKADLERDLQDYCTERWGIAPEHGSLAPKIDEWIAAYQNGVSET